ncbi:MAG: UDP-N-acetylmuramate dehydrogenase [Gemmataceae bacterium]|nr:UDP-N-acetylmuramate dehydrogenase [Gemmataceae bacterium]
MMTATPSEQERTPMPGLEAFAAFAKANEPLAPYTHLKIGGPAEWLVQPRSRQELAAVVRHCTQERIPLRVLGSGCNLLVRDEGVPGVVLRLTEPAFTDVTVTPPLVRAGSGATVSALISQAARHNLAGLESLVGIPGSVGGALRCNAGDRVNQIGQFLRRVEVLDERGDVQVRERDELRFTDRSIQLDDPVILSAEFELDTDDAAAIVKRMRKAWIHRKASQPLSFEAATRVFKNPRGLHASALIEQTGLAQTRVGGAEVSERDPNYIVAHPGATARDVLRLIDLVRSRVKERFGIDLELDLAIW